MKSAKIKSVMPGVTVRVGKRGRSVRFACMVNGVRHTKTCELPVDLLVAEKCMDGGGSSTLVFRNRVVNTPAEEHARERPVADFLYFTDDVPDVKTPLGFRETDERPEGGDRADAAAFPITVDQFLMSCQNVVDTARANGYRYGNSTAEDPTTDGTISCDRLIAKALYDLGYDEQMASAMIGRLTHHCHLILFPGGNNRLRESSLNETYHEIAAKSRKED